MSPVIDGLIRLVAIGSITAVALLAPNALQLLDKPLQNYFKKLDARARQREMKRILSYMKRSGLVTENYEHGLRISKKALKRLKHADLETITIKNQPKWDKRWRVIFYDIPEKQKNSRNQLAFKLRSLDCQQLQRSVWVHPFPCEDEINAVAIAYGVETFITYLETTHINNEKALIKRFEHLL